MLYLPPELPDPGPDATPEQWKTYFEQSWSANTVRTEREAAKVLADFRKVLADHSLRKVQAVEATRDATLAHMRFEREHAERSLIARLVEARATDRTASGAIDKVKVLKDVQDILAVTAQLLPPPPADGPPGLSG